MVSGMFFLKLQKISMQTFKKELITMSKKTEAYIKSSAAGLIAGGLAFMAVNSLSRHSMKRRSTAKVFRMLGALMDTI